MKRTAMRSSNTPKIIFLQKFYEQLGIRCFGSKWDGSEISSTEMVSLEEGLEIRSKLNEALVELQTHYTHAKVDEVFVKDLIAIDQETGVLQTDYIDDLENNKGSGTRSAKTIYELVPEVAHALSRLEASPSLDDEAAFQSRYEAWRRHSAIVDQISGVLGRGELDAYTSTPEGRERIPAEVWGATQIGFHVHENLVVVGRRKFYKVCFVGAEASKVIHEAPAQASSISGTKAAQRDLTSLMSSGVSRRTKADVWREYEEKWGISRRHFDLEWKIACQQTESGWDRAGRPRRESSR
jgi:hypothetical protein